MNRNRSRARAVRGPTAAPVDFRRLAARIKQVSEPTRLRLLLALGDGERHVGGLHAGSSCGMSAVSRHLAVLRLAGLVAFRRDGQRNWYALTGAGRELLRAIASIDGGGPRPHRA
jgi:DNA-binding transcriptional ArsR family regulator